MEQILLPIHPKTVAFTQDRDSPDIDDRIRELTKKHSWKHLPLVCADAPDQICGTALRVGYTGAQEMDLAIYRLRLQGAGKRTSMLPFLYVLHDGIFIQYE